MANGNRFGLRNPHPLSKLKTELVWEGTYDEYGNWREIDVAGCAMTKALMAVAKRRVDKTNGVHVASVG